MATIREIIQGRPIYAAQSSDTILNAARAMVEHNVGAVPVLDGKQLVGVFSERDIMKRVSGTDEAARVSASAGVGWPRAARLYFNA